MQTVVRVLDYGKSPPARAMRDGGASMRDCRFVERRCCADTVARLKAQGHQVEVINDSCQHFGAGQIIWRPGYPAVHGYVAASNPRRDDLAAGY